EADRLARAAGEVPGDVVGEAVDVAGRAGAPGGAPQRPAAEAGDEEALAREGRRLRRARRGRRGGGGDAEVRPARADGDGLRVEVDGRDVAGAVVGDEAERLVLAD